MHRRTKITWLLARGVSRLAALTSSTSGEPTPLGQLRHDAEEKGFARRDSAEAGMLLESTTPAPVSLDGGVRVANLPEKRAEVAEFAAFRRSTADYASYVTAHGVTRAVTAGAVDTRVGGGLGAGFGASPDKRLGFLRPRQLGPLQPAEVSPKYDENGMPIAADESTLTRKELLRRRKEYVKRFEGTTLSTREHFLLVDLDFDKDSVIFGHTREEFERNVRKLQQVILTYTRWERTDNLYRYGTIVLQILTLCVVLEGVYNYYELQLFATHYNTFVEVVERKAAQLEADRQADYARALRELRDHPPDFGPVVAAIAAERRRVEGASATDTSSAPPRTPTVAELARGAAHHPMDTAHEAQAVALQRAQAQRREMERLHGQAVEAAARKDTEGHTLGRALRRLFAPTVSSGPLSRPLQAADFARYSYAASPTSIDAMRAVRRILLPRSEDYVQIVREEMLAYKEAKERRVGAIQQ